MPENKQFIVNIGDQGEIWDSDMFAEKGDALFAKYKDAEVFEVEDTDSFDEDPTNRQYIINLGDQSELWDADMVRAKGAKLMEAYPDVKIQRVSYKDYWGEQATANRERRKALEQPDAERNARLAEIGYYDDLSYGQGEFNMDTDLGYGLKPLSSAIETNSVSGEATYLDPRVQEFFVNDTAETERQAEIARLDAEYESNPAVIRQKEIEAQIAKEREEYIDKSLAEIRADIETEVDAIEAGKGAFYKTASAQGMGDAAIIQQAMDFMKGKDAGQAMVQNERMETYNSAIKLFEKARQAREVAGKGFWAATGDVAKDKLRDLATQSDIEMYNQIGGILTRLEDKLGSLDDVGEDVLEANLSKEEQALIKAFFEYNSAMSDAQQDMSKAYKGGKIFGESVGFMLEFLATGGLAGGTGKAASSGVGRALVKWASKAAKGTAKRAFRTGTTKALRGLSSAAVGTLARTVAAPGTYRNMAEQSVKIEDGHLDRTKNATKAFFDSYIENLSEISGGVIGKSLGMFGLNPSKLLGKVSFGKIGQLLADNRLAQGLSKGVKALFGEQGALTKLGFNGIFEEVEEEYIGNFIREVTGVQPGALAEMHKDGNFGAMLIGFAPMTLFGAGMSAANMAATNIEAANLGKKLRETLGQHYTEDAVSHMMSLVDNAENADEVWKAIEPMAGALNEEETTMLYQYGAFKAQNKVMLFARKAQERQLADAKRAEIQQDYGKFWQEGEDGAQSVQMADLNDGRRVFVLSAANEQGEIAVVDTRTGETGIANVADIKSAEQDGVTSPQTRTWSMDAFLDYTIALDRRSAEQTRMVNERDQQIEALKSGITEGMEINLGTEGSPVIMLATGQFTKDGVLAGDASGNIHTIGWEQVADALGTPIRVKTDQDLIDEETAAIAARRAERRKKAGSASQQLRAALDETAQQTAEVVSLEERHIPKNPDGSVNETAFWEQDPEGYAQWNDEQNKDGGADTMRQLAVSKMLLAGVLAEAQKATQTSNPAERKAAEQTVREIQDKIDRYTAIEQSYVERAIAPLRERAMKWNSLTGASVILVENEEQLAEISGEAARQSAGGARVRGFAKDGRAYIYLPGVQDAAEIDAVFVHEAVSHQGLKGLLGQKGFDELCEQVWQMMSPEMQNVFINYPGVNGNRLAAADEYIAHIAERMGTGVADETERTIWEKIVDFVRNILRAMGIEVGMNERELSDLLHMAYADLARNLDEAEKIAQQNAERKEAVGASPATARQMYDAYIKEGLTPEEVSQGVQNDFNAAKDAYDAKVAEKPTIKAGESTASFIERKKAYNEELGRLEQELRMQQALMDEIAKIQNTAMETAVEEAPVAEEVLEDNGIGVDAENGDARFSIRFTPTAEQREMILDSIMSVTGRTREEAERWLDSETSLAAMVGDEMQYLDYPVDSKYKAIKDNADYPQGTVDFNNICRKRLPFTKMFTRLQRRFPNRVFTADELADIRGIMSQDGLTVACGLCYVEDRRQMVGEVANSFITEMQNGFADYASENATKRRNADKFLALIGEDTYVPSVYELTTQEGADRLYNEHRGIWKAFQAFNNARGQQSQNLLQGYAEYKREILSWSDKKVKSVNDNGGLRIFSYSDFEAHHLLDIVQIIIDCAAKGVKIQGYTKVPAFARAVANTGIKLNRSLIPLGDTGIVDGQLAFDPVEGIDINDPDFLESNDNVGNILIGINDVQIRMAMADPRIHFIIPYHARQKENIRRKLNVGEWVNYISTQNERNLSDGKRVKDNINIYTEVLTDDMTNDRQFVEKYLQLCREKGRIPKFDQFLNRDAEGNYVYTPGYYKFLVDFKLFDENGNILPQRPVVAEFDDAFNMQILEDYVRGEKESTGDQMNETYDKIVEAIGLDESAATGEDVRFSVITPQMDADYLAAVERGDMKTAQRMVLEAAKLAMPNTAMVDRNGYPKIFYHNTDAEFTAFGAEYNGTATDAGWLGDGFYFYGDPNEGDLYGRNKMQVFLNIEEPYYATSEENKFLAEANSRKESIAFSERLKEEWYDGVYYNGDLRQEAVAFYPSQIKSANPVTYDDAGNVIPLSERFNPENEDIRFSVLDTTKAELKDKPIKLNGMHRFKVKSAFKGVKGADGSFPYLKAQIIEVSDGYKGPAFVFDGILEGFADIYVPKGTVSKGEKDNEFFVDPKAIESQLWDVLKSAENYYEFKYAKGPYAHGDNWLNAEGNVLFSVSRGSLVGMHNISEEKLRKVIKQGGSANPSTAVIDIERQAFDSYGEISLIMPSSLVDAETGRNAGTFTADAWTPTYPQIEKRFSVDELQRAYWRDITAIPEEMQHEVRMAFDSWLDNRTASGLAYMFLQERGEAPEMVRVAAKFPQEIKDKMSAILGEGRTGIYELTDEEKQAVLDLYIQENFGGSREDFDSSIAETIQRIEDRLSTGKVPSFVEKRITADLQWMKEHGYNYDNLSNFVRDIVSDIRHAGEVNAAATTNRALDYIKDNNLSAEYEQWKESLNDRYGIKEYLFDGYTPSGNPRWLPNTVENASKLMNKQGLAGATGMASSFNRFVATLAPKKKSLSDIRSSKGHLVEEEKLVDDFRDKWSKVFFDLGIKCQPDAKGYEDYGLERLTEAAQKKNPGAYLKKEYGVELSQEDLQRLADMINAIKTEFPARYFETKFQRPVYLNEFAAAVIPTTTSADIKQAIAEAGLPIFEYDSSADDARREATLKATDMEGVRFSVFEPHNATMDEIDNLFHDYNGDKSLEPLYDKVSALARTMDLKIRFDYPWSAAAGSTFGDKVKLNTEFFNSLAHKSQDKAHALLHEMIHATTNYAIAARNTGVLTEGMKEAVSQLEGIYGEIVNDSAFDGTYGARSVYEMVAELSNPEFRSLLKEKNLFQRIVAAIKRLLGIEVGENALDNLSATLDYMLDNYDGRVFGAVVNEYQKHDEYTRFSIANHNQAIFVSNAARAVEAIKMEKATPEQWLKMIEKNGGLKAGEDKWMGLSDWLKASKAKTLTKKEVLDFINENMIVIEETHYAENAEDDAENTHAMIERILQEKFGNYIAEYYEQNNGEDDNLYGGDSYEYAMDKLREEMNDEFPYTIERSNSVVYLTFPYEETDDLQEWADKLGVKFAPQNPINNTRLAYTTDGLNNRHEIALTIPTIEPWNESDEVHFGDAGNGRAVAWIRFGETWEQRPSPQISRKVLVIDEIQSKRHQEGREKGYKKSNDEIYKALEAFQSFNRSMKLKYGPNSEVVDWSEEDKAEFNRLRDAHSEASKGIYGGVPDAPFDKNWHELAMKRMLRYAAEEGYDVVAWTKGEQQAERYNLGEVVDNVTASAWDSFAGWQDVKIISAEPRDGSELQYVVDREGKIVADINDQYEGRNIAEVFGKEIAVKLLAEGEVNLSNAELRLGSEGMKGFYDRMLPAFMNKYGKKWGVKVEDINLSHLEDGLTMHSVPVTEEMKASVMEGQVMFSVRNTPISPEVRAEMDVIAATAMVNGNYMLAPNGQPTKLTEDQWAMVRTKAFKAWFGEFWEENALFDNLLSRSSGIMGDAMIDSIAESKVLDSVIASIPINVVNNLGGGKRTAQILLHNIPMFVDVMALSSTDADIFTFAVSAMKVVALTRAKLSSAKTTSSNRELLSALDTLQDNLIFSLASLASTRELSNAPIVFPSTRSRAEHLIISGLSAMFTDIHNRINLGTKDTENLAKYQSTLKNIADSIDPENASKVVDENGEPMVVYHGTLSSRFTVFDDSVRKNSKAPKGTYWFAESEDNAMTYAGRGEGIYATFLNLRNPAIIDAGNGAWYELPADFEVYDGNDVDEMFDTMEDAQTFARERGIDESNIEARGVTDTNAFVKKAKDSGKHDGVLIRNVIDAGDQDVDYEIKPTNQYVVFSPSQIKSATDNTGEFSESEDIRFSALTSEEYSEEGTRFSAVTDPMLVAQFESEPKVKVYRAMQLIDGKLYPPMSAYVDGVLREPSELGQWEQAEENTIGRNKKDPSKVDLEQGKGDDGKKRKTSGVLYNPYFHTSLTPLNDQFSGAQTRSNLVIVETEVPQSELTSGYQAEGAANSVGMVDWHSGPIAGVLAQYEGKGRQVILSRWAKPIRIVPESEIADIAMKLFEGTTLMDVPLPSNVFTPALREELERRGMKFVETTNNGRLVSDRRRTWSKTYGKNGLAKRPTEDIRFSIAERPVDEIVNDGKMMVARGAEAAKTALLDRMKNIDKSLEMAARMIASAQREYDRATVKIITDAAQSLLKEGALSKATNYEVSRLLSAVKNATGRKDLTKAVNTLIDIMVANQLRHGREMFRQMLKIKATRVNASGVEAQGRLDLVGQRVVAMVKEAIEMDLSQLEERIGETEDRISSGSETVRSNAEIDLVGLKIAKQYLEGVKASEAEEILLRDELKRAGEDHAAGSMTDEAYREFVKSTEDAVRQNRIERTKEYRNILHMMAETIAESFTGAKNFRDAEKARIERIHHFANSDLQGMSAEAHEQKVNEFWNAPLVRLVTAPLATFEQWMRVFGQKSAEGKGYLYNHFVGGWNDATNAEYLGIKAAHEILDAKVQEVFSGVAKRWSDLFSIDKKMPTATISMWDDGQMRDYEVTQGNLLYVYMVNKMTDGKMKLRKMGITEADVDAIVRQMDPRFLELADWIQDEFLPSLRDKYNAVHERLFGAPMAAIDSYFPIRVLANARVRDIELGADTEGSRPSSITGSIIKRTKNSLALDVLGSNAFDVVLEHIEQMEHWAAFAEFNRDLNTLLSYRTFRNRVQNMSTAFGSGREAWNSFKETAEIVAGVYKPKTSKVDKALTNAVKGLTAGKISLRLWTAMKQVLSIPAFLPYVNPAHFVKNFATPWIAWNWAMDELPAFEKRWRSREAGNVRLKKTDADWKLWSSKIMEIATRIGMTPNAAVDAFTCAIGAKSVYDTMYARYTKDGYSHEMADKKAKLDATVAFNATQQSSESAFVSAIQSDRTFVAHMATVFRNNSFGMGREFVDALRNMRDRTLPGYKEMSIEFMRKQMVREGVSEEDAIKAAERIYRNTLFKDAARIATFGFMMQFLWNLGNNVLYLMFGDDDDEKKEMVKDALIKGAFGSAEGLAFGTVVPELASAVASDKLKNFSISTAPAVSDVKSLWKELNTDFVAGASDLVNIIGQMAIGMNPQTIIDVALAIYDACEGNLDTSKEVAIALLRIVNAPQSNIDRLIMDEVDFTIDEGLDMTIDEFARRYARYKKSRNAPYTEWAYSDEAARKAEEKYIKRFRKDAEALKRTRGNENAQEFYEYYDNGYKETSETLRDLRKRLQEEDSQENRDAMEQFQLGYPFFELNVLSSDIRAFEAARKAMKDADTPEDRGLYESLMYEARDRMVKTQRMLEFLEPYQRRVFYMQEVQNDLRGRMKEDPENEELQKTFDANEERLQRAKEDLVMKRAEWQSREDAGSSE